MATTLTVLVTDGRGVVLGHVGDSRAYLLRDGRAAPDHHGPHLRPAPGRHRPADAPRTAPRTRGATSCSGRVDGDPEGGGPDVVRLDVAGRRPAAAVQRRADRPGRGRADRRACSRSEDPRTAAATLTQAGAGCRRPRQHHRRRRRRGRRAARGRRRPAARRARATREHRRPGAVRLPSRAAPDTPTRGTLAGVRNVERPALEGTVAVRDGRRLSFAEYGSPRGAAIIWMHGTPGARRQIPLEARRVRRRARHPHHRCRPARDRLVDAVPLPGHRRLDRRPRAAARRAGDRHLPADRPVRRWALRAGRRAPTCPSGCTASACSAVSSRPAGPDAIDGGIDPARRPARAVAPGRPGAARRRAHRRRSGWSGRWPAPALDLYAAVQPPGRQEPAVAARSSRRCSSTTCSTAAGSRPRRRSTTCCCSPATGASTAADVTRAGALVARRRRPHRAVPPRPAPGRPAARRHADRRSTGRATSAGSASPRRSSPP